MMPLFRKSTGHPMIVMMPESSKSLCACREPQFQELPYDSSTDGDVSAKTRGMHLYHQMAISAKKSL